MKFKADVSDIQLPNYKNKNYKDGNYEEFPYITDLLLERTRTAFLSTRSRDLQIKAKDNRLEIIRYKNFEDPTAPGPGHYYDDQYEYYRGSKKKSQEFSLSEWESQDAIKFSLDEVLAAAQGEVLLNCLQHLHKKKKGLLTKSGLDWGSPHKLPFKIQSTPGPAHYDYLQERTSQNKKPFNVTSPRMPQVKSMVPLGDIHLNPVGQKRSLLLHAFNSKPTMNPPLIICTGREKDKCSKCHRQIWSKYFMFNLGKFMCLRCVRKMSGTKNWSDKFKLSEYKFGRYCWRYHKHGIHNTQLIFKRKELDYLIRQEVKFSTRTVGVALKEREAVKKRWEAGREGGDIYHQLNLGTDWMYRTRQQLCTSFGEQWCQPVRTGAPGRFRIIETMSGNLMPVLPVTHPYFLQPGYTDSHQLIAIKNIAGSKYKSCQLFGEE